MRSADPLASVRKDLKTIFWAAVGTVHPESLIERLLRRTSPKVQQIQKSIADTRSLYLLAVGKAATGMYSALRDTLSRPIDAGLVVCPLYAVLRRTSEPIEVIRGGHPLPTRASARAGKMALDLAQRMGAGDLLIALISGGASSLMVAPPPGISLREKIATTRLLMNRRVSINELNLVRKHISAIKGGRLLQAIRGGTVISLILSDVPGNDLATIASGLTVPDPTTFSDAHDVLKRSGVWSLVAPSIRRHIKNGMKGAIPETPKTASDFSCKFENLIIGNNETAVDAAIRAARKNDYKVLPKLDLRGDVEELAAQIARRLNPIDTTRACVIGGGEPVVHVGGKGKGGRMQHLALAISIELARINQNRRICVLAAGTDGRDGLTDAAGGFADPDLPRRALSIGVDANEALRQNDSYTLLKRVGALFKTSPTETNVADLLIAIANY